MGILVVVAITSGAGCGSPNHKAASGGVDAHDGWRTVDPFPVDVILQRAKAVRFSEGRPRHSRPRACLDSLQRRDRRRRVVDPPTAGGMAAVRVGDSPLLAPPLSLQRGLPRGATANTDRCCRARASATRLLAVALAWLTAAAADERHRCCARMQLVPERVAGSPLAAERHDVEQSSLTRSRLRLVDE